MEQITMVPVEQLHPHEKNPRIDAASVAELVESIREHGIEVPLVAALHATDGYVVLAGHRRLTAALQVGLAEVPVQIRLDLNLPGDQLAFMATENIHRDQLTPVEESRLVQDMLDLGMTQAEVARQTALGKQRVKDRVKIGKLAEDTGEKVHRGQITVDDALVIAEYSDDPEIAKELEEAAGTYNFDFHTSRAKARREARQAVEKARKDAKKAGLRIVDEDADFVDLADLLTEVGWSTPALEEAGADEVSPQEWEELVIAEHKTCPGHSARIIETGYDAGGTEIGCDQVATQHADAEATVPGAEPEPADPWDDITPEDFSAASISRVKHLATVLPDLNVLDEIKDAVVKKILSNAWSSWMDDADAQNFLQGLTEVEGQKKVAKVLSSWELPALIWLDRTWWDIYRAHKYMSQGKAGSSYWGEHSKLRQLLDDTGYQWTEPEQHAILLATGKAHDATEDDGAALAEGGEAA